MQRRVSPEGARPDEGHYCDEGEDGPDGPDAGGEEDPDIPEYGCFRLLCFLFLDGEWEVEGRVGGENVHNFE